MNAKRWAVVALTALILASCGKSDMRTIKVGRDVFEVPPDRVISSDIYFLSSDQNDALRFKMHPQGELSRQVSVSVQDAGVVCGLPGAKSPNYRGEACSGKGEQFSRMPIRRVNVEHSGGTLWEYFNADGLRVATCSKIGDHGGICTADIKFSNTIVSMRFQDSRVGDLQEIASNVIQVLSEWHVAPEQL